MHRRILLPILLVLCMLVVSMAGQGFSAHAQAATRTGTLAQAFARASSEFGVPTPLLEALCYMEGRLSNHGGAPSVDGGYGCMHLVQNNRVDTLASAAQAAHVSTTQLKASLAENIRGGAALLRQDALQLSANHTLPATLAGWYGAVAAYSNSTTQDTARMYADALYAILNSGFTAYADDGENISLAPQHVTPDTATANGVKAAATLPAGCTNDANTDYPGAVDCILNPSTFDCNLTSPCTYNSSNRPSTYPILFVTIHDIEGTVQDALNVFQDPSSDVSIHYIVDTDGTVYQVLHEKDIAFHNGNYWYNERSVGIEHAGFDATGYQWYNAAEYLGSAKLVAYLLKKYNSPLDHDHIMSHGTTPAPTLGTTPNHVDPGPYWLWDYYFSLINQQGVSFPQHATTSNTLILHPSTSSAPLGSNGAETQANFNFFNLYTSSSTSSALIPNASNGSDITDETYNVEADLCYYYVATAPDSAGTGDTMYEIWYGESDNLPSSQSMNGRLAWLAVPPGAAASGYGTPVELHGKSRKNPVIYGEPVASSTYQIGDSLNNSVFDSPFTLTISGTVWYAINYNHRPMWVPASEVTAI
jgi:N-acetyl-anhydromuramyl-L-alanine amidase AmpD